MIIPLNKNAVGWQAYISQYANQVASNSTISLYKEQGYLAEIMVKSYPTITNENEILKCRINLLIKSTDRALSLMSGVTPTEEFIDLKDTTNKFAQMTYLKLSFFTVKDNVYTPISEDMMKTLGLNIDNITADMRDPNAIFLFHYSALLLISKDKELSYRERVNIFKDIVDSYNTFFKIILDSSQPSLEKLKEKTISILQTSPSLKIKETEKQSDKSRLSALDKFVSYYACGFIPFIPVNNTNDNSNSDYVNYRLFEDIMQKIEAKINDIVNKIKWTDYDENKSILETPYIDLNDLYFRNVKIRMVNVFLIQKILRSKNISMLDFVDSLLK